MGARRLKVNMVHGLSLIFIIAAAHLSACRADSLKPVPTETSVAELENGAAFTLVPFERSPLDTMVIQVNLDEFWVDGISAQELTDEVGSNLNVTVDNEQAEGISISYINTWRGTIVDDGGNIIGRYGAPLMISFSTEKLADGIHYVIVRSRGPSGATQFFGWKINCQDGCVLID